MSATSPPAPPDPPTGSTVVRVLIVDDHPVVRDGLHGMLAGDERFLVVGEAADGGEALAALARTPADVVLTDLRMPGMGGVETITRLRDEHPQVSILVLTTYDTDADVLPAIRAGATGYLLKDTPRHDLVNAILAAAAGRPVLAPSVAGRLMELLTPPGDDEPELSPRELQVLQLVAAGTTNAAIARELFISEATVKTHLLHLYDKLQARDRASAVATAYQRGLLH